MRVTISTAGAQTCVSTIRHLIKTAPEGTQVHGIYRDLAKVPKEFNDHPSFTATKGSVSDASSLDFTGSNVVLAITPPVIGSGDPIKAAEEVAENVKKAIEAAGTVKRLVLLSSMGAECDEGVGEILTNNRAEKILATTDVPEIIFLRAAYFMENWTMMNAPTLLTDKPLFHTVLTPLDHELAMVAVEDIGANLAKGLISSYTPPVKPYTFELHGPRGYTSKDVHAAFNAALGKEVGMELVPPEGLADYFGTFLPPDDVPLFVDMTKGFLPGGVMLSPNKPAINIVRGKTDLNDAIKAAVAALRAT